MANLNPDQTHNSNQGKQTSPPSKVVYSLDIIGLHGTGFMVPKSPAHLVESAVKRFGFNRTVVVSSIVAISILLMTLCLTSFFCSMISSLTG